MRIALTVFFESPFWVGILERTDGQGRLYAARHVFGAEPSDPEVWAWVLHSLTTLDFSPAAATAPAKALAANPKRRQRQAAKALSSGTGTRSQQALQAGREAAKEERRAQSRERREADEQRKYLLKRERQKQRHRGR